MILSVGSLKSDFNTGNFTYNIPVINTVEVSIHNNLHNFVSLLSSLFYRQLHSGYTQIKYATYPNIGMKHLLPKLADALSSYRSSALKISVPPYKVPVPDEAGNEKITHAWLWPKVATDFFKQKDIIVSETGSSWCGSPPSPPCSLILGTSNFGLLDVPMPNGSIFVSQILWGSIGWAGGALYMCDLEIYEGKLLINLI